MFNNILEAIGNTPLVRINRMLKKQGVEIYAKLEGFNPTGSIKDRIALRMIRQAQEEGKLTPGKTIIEATSGNTGIALAMIGTVLGYEVEIVMSEAVSIERQKMIKGFGGKLTLSLHLSRTVRVADGGLHSISCVFIQTRASFSS